MPTDESRSANLWRQIRRALARLLSSTSIQHIAADQLTIGVMERTTDMGAFALRVTELTDELVVTPSMHADVLPRAIGGSDSADLCAIKHNVSRDLAVSATSTHSSHIAVIDKNKDAAVFLLKKPAHQSVLPVPVMMRLFGGTDRGARVKFDKTILIGGVSPMQYDRVRVRRVSGTDGAGTPKKSHVYVRYGLQVMTRLPMVLISATRNGLLSESALFDARLRLANVANVTPDEITLSGIFKDVPVLALSGLVLDEDRQALLVSFKSEALGKSVPPSKRVTIALGRRQGSNKIIQAVL